MVARIYSIIFLAILIVGFIYQESYMQMTMSEFSQKVDTDRLPFEIFSMTPLSVRQYNNGVLTSELKAAEGRLVTTGRFTAQGSVQMTSLNPDAPPAERLSSVKSDKLIASLQRTSGMAFDIFGGSAKFERVEIPGSAEILSRGHTLVGRAFALDVPNMTLVTKDPVTVTATGRKIEAQGAEVDLRTRAFKFAGPVRGSENPPPQAAKPTRSRSQKTSKKRARASGGRNE